MDGKDFSQQQTDAAAKTERRMAAVQPVEVSILPRRPRPDCCDDPYEVNRDRRMRERAWDAAGVPTRHKAAIHTVTPGGAWAEKLAALAGRLGDGFLAALLGGRGGGKTQMAANLIHAHITAAERPSARYVRATEILMALKETYRRDATETEAGVIARFARPRLLVIDEAHERGESEWEGRILTHLIDLRYAEARDTLLISNHEPKRFRESVGESIYSRLAETGGVIVCDWPSFRAAARNRA